MVFFLSLLLLHFYVRIRVVYISSYHSLFFPRFLYIRCRSISLSLARSLIHYFTFCVTNWTRTLAYTVGFLYTFIKLDTFSSAYIGYFVREWEKEISITKQPKYIFNFSITRCYFLFLLFLFFFFFFRYDHCVVVRFFCHVRGFVGYFWPFDWPLLLFLLFFVITAPFPFNLFIYIYNSMDDIVPMQTYWDFVDILSSVLARVCVGRGTGHFHLPLFGGGCLFLWSDSFLLIFLSLFCFGICNWLHQHCICTCER